MAIGGPAARELELTVPGETRAATQPKAEGSLGFEIGLVMAAICALYVLGRKIRR